jgi:hypothetical protein
MDARAVVAAAAEEAELGDKAPAERKIPARRANLGDSILLSAVEDYMGTTNGTIYPRRSWSTLPIRITWNICAGFAELTDAPSAGHSKPALFCQAEST